MAGTCDCNLVGAFPVKAGYHIISATLRSRTEFRITPDQIYLEGPTVGDLSITAYAPLEAGEEFDKDNPNSLQCRGRAGASYTWNRRIDCDTTGIFVVYMVPGGESSAYREGDVTSQISLEEKVSHESINASASSGPFTIYMATTQHNGYSLKYTGIPIPIDPVDDPYNPKDIDIFQPGVLPNDSFYLTSFSWEYTPPNIPTVSYSFLFLYNGG